MFSPGLIYRLRNEKKVSYFIVTAVEPQKDGTTMLRQRAFTAPEDRYNKVRMVEKETVEDRVVADPSVSFQKCLNYVKRELKDGEFDFFVGNCYIAANSFARKQGLRISFLLKSGVTPKSECLCL